MLLTLTKILTVVVPISVSQVSMLWIKEYADQLFLIVKPVTVVGLVNLVKQGINWAQQRYVMLG